MQNPGQTQLFHKPCQTLLIRAKHDSVDPDNLDDPTCFQPWFVGIDFLEPIFVKAHSGLDIIWICFIYMFISEIPTFRIGNGFNCYAIFELFTKIYFMEKAQFNNIRQCSSM